MTSLTIPARPVAIHSVHEFVLVVPDLEKARHFHENFGHDVRQEGDALALYCFNHPHRWARFLPGKQRKLQWVSLGIYAEDETVFSERIKKLGLACAPPPGADVSGLWLKGPDGLPLQLVVADKVSPSQPAPREFPPECQNKGRAPAGVAIPKVHPLYLSHILIFTQDVAASLKFYHDVLGMKLSDQTEPFIAFMHTPHGCDHHLIALALSPRGRGFHHSSWCVPSVDAVGLGMRQMTKAGYPDGWGVGRHFLGSNYFRYVKDPWGSYAEYSADIDFVKAGDEWPAANHPTEDSLYIWGPDVPEGFINNME